MRQKLLSSFLGIMVDFSVMMKVCVAVYSPSSFLRTFLCGVKVQK